MLDLDVMLAKSLKVKLHDEIINLNQPTKKMVDKINTVINNAQNGELDSVEVINAQYDIVGDILNNNTSARKFTKSEVEALPVAAIVAIINGNKPMITMVLQN